MLTPTRILPIFLLCSLSAGTLAASWRPNAKPPPASLAAIVPIARPTPLPTPKSTPIPTPLAPLSLALTGDVLPLWVKNPLRDEGVRAILQRADIAFCNLEGPLSTRGTPAPIKFRRTAGGRQVQRHKEWIFGATAAEAATLKNAGYDVVSLANNHSMDYGASGLADTWKALAENGIVSAGSGANLSQARRGVRVDKNGWRVRFLAYVADETLPGTTGFAAADETPGVVFVRSENKAPTPETLAQIKADIGAARRDSDAIVVSLHWGQELRRAPDDWQKSLAHAAVEAGATLVVGHHGHRLQGVEIYRGRPIFYSLGNFVFHTPETMSQPTGIACLELQKQDGKTAVKNIEFHPAWIENARPLTVAAQAAPTIRRLREASAPFGTVVKRAKRDGKTIALIQAATPPAPRKRASIETRSVAQVEPKNAQLETRSAAQLKPEKAIAKTPAKARTVAPAATKKAAPRDSDWIEVARVVPSVVVDLPYASGKNAFKTKFYPLNRCFVRRGVAARLPAVAKTLARSGLRLKIWDGYRPLSIQRKMWNQVRDARYIANPARGGSRHNRGAALDVTLVDAKGRELPMPTGFDDFSARAHLDSTAGTTQQKHNRALLQNAMKAAGFAPLATEWWHFDAPDARRYPVADVSLQTLVAGAEKGE